MLEKVKNWYKKLPDRKPWVDLMTAVLTIPVLVTVIIINVDNLKKDGNASDTNKTTLAPTIIEKVVTQYVVPSPGPTDISEGNPVVTETFDQTVTPTPICNLDPQPYEITYPKEGENVNVDPVCIAINKQGENFCTTQWAYRVNNSSWSTYTSDPICLYNMADGQVKLEIRTKSTVSGREKTYTRNFSYGTILTPTKTSAGPTVTPPG
ncbi:MAG: hypothetical protein UV73_C0007G0002 [Candidatus Gottesmanbacteria bacterium GW2011_GWA2_43_14]|uniref:Uncharacterized protein n=1 Tax=Candidatus Gottesmanbacteria bacterium GW2011_GWA2_43_14 TaxID=1618443 RepID=A0A0G1DIN7_9BACT|nr:MAG: hypothetical protein UV73_C0007G0002 [Candidatus Gottesmanbacteria bacterium GW2011_GWA2_43_14]